MGEESEGEEVSPPPCKRQDRGHMENNTEEEVSPTPRPDRETLKHNTIPGTNIKITTRGEGSESSLVVSMELNGLTYQGILFQQGDTTLDFPSDSSSAASTDQGSPLPQHSQDPD